MSQAGTKIVETKWYTYTAKGRRIAKDVTMAFVKGRIEFLKAPFEFKDELKSMRGSRWHGYIEGDNRKIWSVEDCFRNRFQIQYLSGEDPYAWFDQEVKQHEYTRPLRSHQREMADHFLTYHYGIMAAEMGVGKTLVAISIMEMSGVKDWWFVAPKKVCEAIKREFKKWNLSPAINVELMTYEAFTRRMDEWTKDEPLPQGVVFDESSRLKTDGAQRTKAAQFLADKIRERHGYDGYVILMSGTPSPKSPVDWWSQAEIAWPGFLREGSERAFKYRLAFLADREFGAGGVHKELVSWRDDERKCDVCGLYEHEGPHQYDLDEPDAKVHKYKPSVNEVALMYERLKGLVIIKHKKDCLELPDKQYRIVRCPPSPATLRVAQAIAAASPTAVQGATLLRELSDGFMYREEKDGMTKCPTCHATGEIEEWYDPNDEERTFGAIDFLDPELVEQLQKRNVTCPRCEGTKEVPKMVRVAKEVPCPKEDALKELLEENEEHGRIVVAGGFTGSVDRIQRICLSEGWDVVRCDGTGFRVFRRESDGEIKCLHKVAPLDYWADMNNPRVAFVCHPESGGLGLTLTEACMLVVWSNSFKPEYRIQLEDRIHRDGMDTNRGATIVDLIHLPTDERTLRIIRENRKLELLTMGEFIDETQWEP